MMRAWKIWEIREYDRQIQSTGVGCGLSKDEIRTSPSEAMTSLLLCLVVLFGLLSMGIMVWVILQQWRD